MIFEGGRVIRQLLLSLSPVLELYLSWVLLSLVFISTISHERKVHPFISRNYTLKIR